jgi:hypothetical protein
MTDELTEDGILTDHPDITLLDCVDLHGGPIHVGEDRVIFRDEHGHELSEWADVLGVSWSELSSQMHELARESYRPDGPGDPWSSTDPVVFDADTFRRDNFEAIALLLRRGCSPAEVLDWFATKDQNWTQTDWSEFRGVSQQNVSGNVTKALETLNEVDY